MATAERPCCRSAVCVQGACQLIRVVRIAQLAALRCAATQLHHLQVGQGCSESSWMGSMQHAATSASTFTGAKKLPIGCTGTFGTNLNVDKSYYHGRRIRRPKAPIRSRADLLRCATRTCSRYPRSRPKRSRRDRAGRNEDKGQGTDVEGKVLPGADAEAEGLKRGGSSLRRLTAGEH
jgi:hypothetical protein